MKSPLARKISLGNFSAKDEETAISSGILLLTGKDCLFPSSTFKTGLAYDTRDRDHKQCIRTVQY